MLETRWPLADQAKELSRLTAALVARRGAVITGPAGAGKTTLAIAGAMSWSARWPAGRPPDQTKTR
jgi:MoxR-like ATPase